ncbi:hypothetical protein [Sandaracinus amylolyticus]|uniref:Uncharacterized protein n=1 Tax=Sandaracinus amylolyticus TaxID=927083 RepID=A0A0F6YI80_9BACT|nr:hypothetical protein [Sandaracinus amylolyticus]AKF06428.1 hypothetical protein DB32_003577 [Sandaracinus amylolyticus]
MIGNAIPLALVLAISIALPSTSSAQRRRREPPPPPPAELSLATISGDTPFRRVLTIRASAPIELNADRRLLRIEVRPEGARRALTCEHPERPARLDADRVVRLEAGQTWQEWIDLREYCWGRALDALSAGGDVAVTFGPRRARRGDVTLRVLGEPPVDHRELGPTTVHLDAMPRALEPDPSARVRVVMSDRDARSITTFSVRVRAREGRARAYVRPDRFSFRVHGPDADVECAMPHGGGAVPADLFQRLSARGGPSFTLDARAFCPEGTFDDAGIYEVVPVLELEHDGAQWNLDAPTGTFVGAPAFVRVRRDARGYVERGASPPGRTQPGGAG